MSKPTKLDAPFGVRVHALVRWLLRNEEKLLCLGFVAFMVGFGASSIGELPKHPDEPFPWYSPLLMLFITGLPALLAYQAGRKDGPHD